MSEAYEGRQIVGIDLHRRRSVLVRMPKPGATPKAVRISNDVEYLRQVMAHAGERPAVVLEATYGWYWAAARWPSWARACIWRTRWGSRRSSIGG